MKTRSKKSKKGKKASQKPSEISESASIDERMRKILQFDLSNPISTQQVLEIRSDSKEFTRPLSSIANFKSFTFEELKAASTHSNPDEEKCAICMFEFSAEDSTNIVKLHRCEGHYFHIDCIEMCHTRAHLRCPICGVIYGIMTGDMPAGSMLVIRYPPEALTLEGIPDTPVYEISYRMKAGTRGDIQFPSTQRSAFLPCNDEGKEILRLLIIAFERRLTFTLGTSVTTGRTNQIIWNGIHHKTSVEGGPPFFGYPDPTYFSRVREELAAKGIY